MDVRKWLRRWLGEESGEKLGERSGKRLTERLTRPLGLSWIAAMHPATRSFAVQTLYDRYGTQIYQKVAGDPAFAAAVDALARATREDLLACPDFPDKSLHDPTAMHAYLLGFAHGVLDRLLERAVQAELGEPDSGPCEIAVSLGALFQLGFDARLIKMTLATDDE